MRGRDDVAEADLLVFLREREMGVVSPGRILEQHPGLDRDFAVGLRRKGKDDFTGVDGGVDTGQPLAGALLDHYAVRTLSSSTSWSVFQLMPLPPLPSLFISGPSEVKRL